MLEKNIGKIFIILIVACLLVVCIYLYLTQEINPENPPEPDCGDGYCDPDFEDETTCPGDCGCNDNGICEPNRGETADNCPDCATSVECDGDGICEPDNGETPQNCDDCGCNSNDICEPSRGEDRFTCEDCVERPAEPKGLGFRLPALDKKVGNTFWVEVYYDPSGTENIATYILDIGWNPSVLQYVSHEGAGDWEQWFYPGNVESDAITFCQSMDVDGQNTRGTLLRINFKAIGTGVSTLDFDFVEIQNTASVELTVPFTGSSIRIYGED